MKKFIKKITILNLIFLFNSNNLSTETKTPIIQKNKNTYDKATATENYFAGTLMHLFPTAVFAAVPFSLYFIFNKIYEIFIENKIINNKLKNLKKDSIEYIKREAEYQKNKRKVLKIIKLIISTPAIFMFLKNGLPSLFNYFKRLNYLKNNTEDGFDDTFNKIGNYIINKKYNINTYDIIKYNAPKNKRIFIYINGVGQISTNDIVENVFKLKNIEIDEKNIELEYRDKYYSEYDPNNIHYQFLWGGNYSQTIRDKASKDLSSEIIKLRKDFPDKEIILMAHSYGGEIAIEALNSIKDEKVIKNNDNKIYLTTMASPLSKNDSNIIYNLTSNNIIKYISFSNVFDTTATYDPLNKSTFNVDDLQNIKDFPNDQNRASFIVKDFDGSNRLHNSYGFSFYRFIKIYVHYVIDHFRNFSGRIINIQT
jgi:hypothetical protein